MAEPSSRVKDAQKLLAALEEERSRDDFRFKMVTEHILPHRGFWPDQMSGDNTSIAARAKKMINPAATQAIERVAGGMTAGMTPEGLPWLGLTIGDKKALERGGIRDYLGACESAINALLRHGGFYQSTHYANVELWGFGNYLLFCDSDDTTMARYEACTMGTWCIALDSSGKLDTVTRRMRWSARQISKKFGEKRMSRKALKLLKASPYARVLDVVHIVRPRDERKSGGIDKLSMPWQSIMFEPDVSSLDSGGDVLSESGYNEMPYFHAPHTVTGASAYGVGPGDLLLLHSKQLQETERQKLIALQKAITPPMRKPSAMKQRLDLSPGAENDVGSNEKDAVGPLYTVDWHAYEMVLKEINDLALRIAAVAKADLFYDMPMELRPKDMTATEYMERKRERLQQIAPVVSMYEPNVLDKVVARAYSMLDKAGLLPPPPPMLREIGSIEIQYNGTVSRALRQSGAEATRVVIADVAGLADMQVRANMRPTALLKLDVSQAVDEIAAGVGAPSRLIVDDDVFEQRMKEMDEAEARQAEQQQQMEAAEAAAKLGSVKTEGTMAGQMMGAENGAL